MIRAENLRSEKAEARAARGKRGRRDENKFLKSWVHCLGKGRERFTGCEGVFWDPSEIFQREERS
jgi:hypothetical protein